jgi:hypothetical protein
LQAAERIDALIAADPRIKLVGKDTLDMILDAAQKAGIVPPHAQAVVEYGYINAAGTLNHANNLAQAQFDLRHDLDEGRPAGSVVSQIFTSYANHESGWAPYSPEEKHD